MGNGDVGYGENREGLRYRGPRGFVKIGSCIII